MTAVRLDQVSKRFGSTLAVDRVSLDIAAGELFFLLGPSGCGKTTLLRLVAGFLQPDSGEIYFDGQPMRHVPVQRRNLGIVFQHYALWPHRTVFDNIAYGLEVRRLPRAEIQHRVQEMLQLMRLEACRDRYPAQLSGGQQQRVAMARALVIRPRLLLLDEPLSNLDAALRQELREEIRRVQRSLGITTLYVTHDQEEALALADRLAILHQGCVLQVGTPRQLYEQPRNQFIAGFLGRGNILPAIYRGQAEEGLRLETPLGIWRVAAPPPTPLTQGQALFCLVRAEHWQPAGPADPNAFEASVKRIEFHGDHFALEVIASELTLTWRVPAGQWSELTSGQTIRLSAPPHHIVLLPE